MFYFWFSGLADVINDVWTRCVQGPDAEGEATGFTFLSSEYLEGGVFPSVFSGLSFAIIVFFF